MPRTSSLADAARHVPVTLGHPQVATAQARRLAELGLRAGAEVMVLHRTAGGGRLVAVGDGRIALDRQTLAALPVVDPAGRTAPATPEAGR